MGVERLIKCNCGKKYRFNKRGDIRRRQCPSCGQALSSAVILNSKQVGQVANVPNGERIKVRCPKCEKKLQAPLKAIGKPIQCPACSTKLAVSRSGRSLLVSIAPSNDLSDLLDEADADASRRCVERVQCEFCQHELQEQKQICPQCNRQNVATSAAKQTSKKLRRTGQVALGVGISVVYYHLILSFTNPLLLFAGVLFKLPSLLAIIVWAQGILLLSSPIGMLICAFAPVPVSRRLVVLALVAQVVAVVFHFEPIEDPRLGVLASLVVQNLPSLLGLGSYMLFVEYMALVGAGTSGVESSIQQIRNRTVFLVFFPMTIILGQVVVAFLSVAFGGIFFVVVMSILVLIYLGVWLLWLKEYLELLSYLKSQLLS